MPWEAWHRDLAGTDTTASAEIVSELATSERKEELLTARPGTSAGRWEITRGMAGLAAKMGQRCC